MSTRPDLIRQLNKLKRDERVLKTEELVIRQDKAVKNPRDLLARNHELRMKNKRHQGQVTRELGVMEALAATIAAQPVAEATSVEPLPPPPEILPAA